MIKSDIKQVYRAVFIADSDPTKWTELNRQVRSALNLKEFSGSISVFQTPYHAILEILLSLSQLYSHKTEILVPVESSPYWRNLAADGTRLGIRSHLALTAKIPEVLSQKINKKSLLMAWQAVDDPILAQTYADDWMAELLSEKIFCIKLKYVFNTSFVEQLKSLNPFEGYVLSLAPGLSVAVLGERIKMVPLVAPHAYWNRAFKATLFAQGMETSNQPATDKERIKEFEQKVLDLGALPLTKSDQRIWDRAWITFKDLNGSAVRDYLIDSNSSYAENIETLSACRWPLAKKFEWLYEQGFTPNDLRGSLMVRGKHVHDKSFFELLEQTVQKIKSAQG